MESFYSDIRKMRVSNGDPILYYLKSNEGEVLVNDWLNKNVRIEHTGDIICVSCKEKTYKSFNQGFCYDCFRNAPEAAECIIKPELCRAHLGEGRDIEWEMKHHVQPHYVYLASSSGLKVGITRDTQIPTRWIDQGASFAGIIAEVPNRYLSGVIEVALKEHFSDKTAWQRMLKNEVLTDPNFNEAFELVKSALAPELQQYLRPSFEAIALNYPVLAYPQKVKSVNLDKLGAYEGKLVGIKGQYLIFEDNMVINIRKYTGYQINFTCWD